MERSREIFLINPDVRAIKALYDPDIDPTGADVFKTFDTSIKPDDYLVVESSTRHKMTVVRVTEVDVDFDIRGSGKINWIVGKIDAAPHKALLEEENAAVKKLSELRMRKERDDLRKTMLAEYADEIDDLPIAQISGPKTEDSAKEE